MDDAALTEPLAPSTDAADHVEDATISEPPPLDADGLDEKARRSLEKVLDEVVTTERAYVAALGALATAFLPLLRPHLEGEVAEVLATTASALHGVHRELLERLESAGKDMWGVSRAFSLMTPFLRMYATYCGGYTRALARVAEVRRTAPALSELESSRGEMLDSLLIRPVQRLCKYPLFFGELLRLLPAGGGLRREFEAAAAAIRSVSEEVNTRTKGVAEGARLVELHHELGGKVGALLAPTRSLILEVEVKLATRGASRRAHKLVLLTDAVILARIRRASTALVRSALSLSRSSKPSSRRASQVEAPTGGRSALKLLAVLPLHALTLQSAAPRAARSKGGAAAASHANRLLLLCREPPVSYSCKCADADAAAALMAAVASARDQLDQARLKSERRASLVAPEAAAADASGTGAGGTTESLVAAARTSRRKSLTERLGVGSSRRSSSTPDAACDAAAAGAGVPSPISGESSELGLIGLVCSSDGESEDEGSGSEQSSASEYEDE